MNTLLINTNAEAVAIGSMMEGRWENLRDDNDPDLPVLDATIKWFWNATNNATYPLSLPVETAFVEQIQATLENIIDQDDDWNGDNNDNDDSLPFTAILQS